MKVLAYTSPAKGHLFPIVPTLLALRSRGHEVHVRTLASEVDRVRGLGLGADAMAPAIEARENDDWKGGNPMAALRRTLRAWLDRAVHELDDLPAAIAAHAPDALLVDVNAWGALAAAEGSGLPFAVWSPYFLPLDLPGRPPFGPGLAPWPGLLGGLRDAAARAVTRLATGPSFAELNQLRTARGLRPLGGLGDLGLQGEALLYLTAEPFEYGHGGWPAKVRMVGPGSWEPPGPDWTPPSDRPVVLVTCSTEFQDDGRLIEAALAGLADEDVHVVATTAALDPDRFRAPPNATVVRFAPHGPILRHAVAAVCHGGMGITQKALGAGVPVCVVPFGRDQLEVARRVEVCGAGTQVAPGALTPERLRDAVRRARERKAGAEAVARAFAAAGGASAAADVVEGLAYPLRAAG